MRMLEEEKKQNPKKNLKLPCSGKSLSMMLQKEKKKTKKNFFAKAKNIFKKKKKTNNESDEDYEENGYDSIQEEEFRMNCKSTFLKLY